MTFFPPFFLLQFLIRYEKGAYIKRIPHFLAISNQIVKWRSIVLEYQGMKWFDETRERRRSEIDKKGEDMEIGNMETLPHPCSPVSLEMRTPLFDQQAAD